MSDSIVLVEIMAVLIYLMIYRKDKVWGSLLYMFLSAGTFVLTKGTDNFIFSLLFLIISLVSFLSSLGSNETNGGDAINRLR